MSTHERQSSIKAIASWSLRYWPTAALVLLFGAVIELATAARTEGPVKVLGIRVAFADYDNAPTLETISNKLATAEGNFERFSYNVMRVSYDTVSVELPNNRGTYTASSLANAAENKARNMGFDEADYHVVAFFHGGHSSGNKAIVNGKRLWLTTGGAITHEMGHVFNFGHQNRFAPSGQNPLVGELKSPDHWHFMKNGGTDPEPYEKWQRNWITDFHRVQNDGTYTKRLYSFDDPDIDPSLTKRALRVRRTTATSTDLWIGFRSRLLDNVSSAGKNHHLRQGLAFYWDRGDVGGQSTVLLDMHPGTAAGFEDHALQPGETFANPAGGVFITHLGRGGTQPNEYIDVRINRGTFPDNQPPAPSWDAPSGWLAGTPLTITVTPGDPDGDEVACMWTTSDKDIPYNTSANSLTKTWNTAGSYTIDVVVSDMKGGTATLSRTIEITGGFPTTQWTGSTTGQWYLGSNWSPTEQPNSPTASAAWSSAFTGANQLGLGSGRTKQLRQIRLEESLSQDVTVTLDGSTLELFGGGIDLSDTEQSLTVGGAGALILQDDQQWLVSSLAQLSVAPSVDLNGQVLTLAPEGPVVLSGVVHGAGQFRVDGPGSVTLEGVNTYPGSTVVAGGRLDLAGSGSLAGGDLVVTNDATLGGTGVVGGNASVHSGAFLAPGPGGGLGELSFAADLVLEGDVEIAVDPGASPNSDRVGVAGTISGANAGNLIVGNIGAPFAPGQEFAIFDQPLPGGAAWGIDPPQPAPGLAWENRLAVDGSIAVVVDPTLITFENWVEVISGLSGAGASFEADPNDDGIPNGLAFLSGAPDAMADATGLMPTYHYTPPAIVDGDEVPGQLVIVYRRWNEAAITVQSGVEFSTDFAVWNPVTLELTGATIEIDEDFFGSGVDRIRVGIPDTLATGGTLFGRLRVWP
ncbi:PKD domain-containing protein [Akkermansiaceae bacterium]|nr:PKD domain-containing protein [Akkermansiaceae bacterium]